VAIILKEKFGDVTKKNKYLYLYMYVYVTKSNFFCSKLRNALDLYVTRNKTWRGLSLISCYRNL